MIGSDWLRLLGRFPGFLALGRLRENAATWARTHEIDGASFASLYVLVLAIVPASQVVGPLGAGGTPANILAATGAVCWLLLWLMTRGGFTRGLSPVPVRAAASLFLVAVLASYVVAMLRPLRGEELNSMNTGLILVLGWAGILMVLSDGIASRARLELVVTRVTSAVGVIALVGLAQFITSKTLTDSFSIPGLSVNSSPQVYARDGFSRVIGTTINPIEFGVLMAAMLPLCVHVGMHRSGSWMARWWPTCVVATAIPLSNSRSSLVALAIALMVIAPTWSPPVRLRALVVGVLGGCAVFVLIPGLLGTLLSLFQGLEEDSSATSRTGSYELAMVFINRSPIFGRGFMTFLPEYRVLDNQYLGLLIDTGVAGTAAMVVLFVVALTTAFRARALTRHEPSRSLAAALGAGVSASAVSFAFFDALAFTSVAGFTALLLALIEVQWRIAVRARDGSVPAEPGERTRRTE